MTTVLRVFCSHCPHYDDVLANEIRLPEMRMARRGRRRNPIIRDAGAFQIQLRGKNRTRLNDIWRMRTNHRFELRLGKRPKNIFHFSGYVTAVQQNGKHALATIQPIAGVA